MVAGEAGVVRSRAGREPRLRGDENAVAAAGERFAEDLLGEAIGIDVGSVDEVDAGVEALVDLPGGELDVGCADDGEHAAPPEGHRSEREGGDAQARATELAIFHVDGFRIACGRVCVCTVGAQRVHCWSSFRSCSSLREEVGIGDRDHSTARAPTEPSQARAISSVKSRGGHACFVSRCGVDMGRRGDCYAAGWTGCAETIAWSGS